MQALPTCNVPVAIKDDNVEVRMTEVGDMTASIIRLAKGTDLAPALVGLPDDLCPCPHWGYMLEGRLLMHTPVGDQTYEAGHLMDENDQTGQYLLDRATLECEYWEHWERRPLCRRPQLPPMWGGGLCGLVAPADVTARASFRAATVV